jgi:hypothetical protein
MRSDDFEYYARRAWQEEAAALRATCEAARDAHRQMAQVYRSRCAFMLCSPAVRDPCVTERGQPLRVRQPIIASNTNVLPLSAAVAPKPARPA